jgi:hypothetical protein
MKTIIIGGLCIYVLILLFKFSKKRNKNASKTKESDDINLNDHFKRKIEIFKAAQKAGLVSKETKVKSNNVHLVVPNVGPYDGLIGWAAYIIATGNDSSTSHVQRLMTVNYDRAYNIIRSLMEIGMLKENGTKQHTVLIRDLNRLKEILDNLKK